MADANLSIGIHTSQAERDAKKLVGELNKLQNAADRLSDGADFHIDSTADADAKQISKSIKEIEDSAKKAAAAADAMGAAIGRAARNEEALELLGEALLAVATSILTANTSFEDYEDAVRSATGSSEAAALAMGMIEDFALNSAFAIEDVTNAFVELKDSGLEASKASLTSYGNAAAALNLTMEEMAQAVGDAAARNFNKLNETQLKARESGDKVIFTYQGVSTQVKNTSKDIAGFIKQMGDTEFAGRMADQAEGLNGAFEAMSDAWKELARDMGEGGLNQGLISFAESMAEASRAAEDLGRLVGWWLGGEIATLGNFIESTVRDLANLAEGFYMVVDAIKSIPGVTGALSAVTDALLPGMETLPFPERGGTEEEAAATPETRSKAFGTDTETPKRTRGGKSEAQRQQEAFEKQFAGNERMIKTLGMMNDAYDHGRVVVASMRHEIEDTADKTQLLSQVGEKNVEAIMDQRAAMKGLKEAFAYKGEVLDQQEAIMQTVQLTEAYKSGSGAVKDAQASIEAYNTAVQFGVVGSADLVKELEVLARAAIQANDNLKFEQSMAGFDQEIEAAARMATAFREGGPAIREAAFEQEVYAQAVADGVEEDEAQVQIIREKMQALRDLQDTQRDDERAMNIGLDIEQMQRELGLTRLMGEARFMEAARIEMLMNKKRELKDVTAELTNEELKQADALGRMQYQAANAGNSLLELAERYGDVNKQMQNVALGGALALEDSLVDIVTGAKTAREAFADFARTVAEQMMRAAIQMAVIRPLLMGLGGMFAGGGVMTSSGPMALTAYAGGGVMGNLGDIPLKTYAEGGIANSPQMAIFGEGKMPEAYVPLPDGRRIPVKMEGGGGGGNAVSFHSTVNVNMPQNATREQGEQFGDAIARQVEDAMNANLMKQQRPGGLLDPYGYGQTG